MPYTQFTTNDNKDQTPKSRAIKAFELASSLRALILTNEHLSHIEVEPVENLLDSLEEVVIRLTKADISSYENSPRTEIQT